MSVCVCVCVCVCARARVRACVRARVGVRVPTMFPVRHVVNRVDNLLLKKVKVNQSRYRPGQAQRVPGS